MSFAGNIPNDQGLPSDRRQPSTTALAAAGVSFGPPTGARWKIYHISIKLVTSSSAGSRTVLVYMTDGTTAPTGGVEGANVIIEWVNSGTIGTGRTVAATTTERYVITLLAIPSTQGGAFLGNTLFFSLNHPIVLQQLQKLIIQDTAQIDTSGDKVTIEVLCEEWIEQ